MTVRVYMEHSLMLSLFDVDLIRQLLAPDNQGTHGANLWLALMFPSEYKAGRRR